MKRRVETVCENLCGVVTRWDGVAAVIFEGAQDIEFYHPYFNIDLEVFYQGSVPDSQQRRDGFGSPQWFETSPDQTIDRFFQNDLPITLHYRRTDSLTGYLDRIESGKWVYRPESTNILYKIKQGQVLFSAATWLDDVSARVKSIQDSFWHQLKDDTRYNLDYSLNNLGAAVYRGDFLYYRIAAGSFVRNLCSFLFALNKEFEPSSQLLYEHVKRLKDLPEDFNGRFESFIRANIKLSPQKRFELAQLLAKSIASL